jgi:hypothetical protein
MTEVIFSLVIPIFFRTESKMVFDRHQKQTAHKKRSRKLRQIEKQQARPMKVHHCKKCNYTTHHVESLRFHNYQTHRKTTTTNKVVNNKKSVKEYRYVSIATLLTLTTEHRGRWHRPQYNKKVNKLKIQNFT